MSWRSLAAPDLRGVVERLEDRLNYARHTPEQLLDTVAETDSALVDMRLSARELGAAIVETEAYKKEQIARLGV